jgi:hypothetical protein
LAVHVTTEAIIAAHHFSIIGAFQHGQQEFFTATRLTGTAA